MPASPASTHWRLELENHLPANLAGGKACSVNVCVCRIGHRSRTLAKRSEYPMTRKFDSTACWLAETFAQWNPRRKRRVCLNLYANSPSEKSEFSYTRCRSLLTDSLGLMAQHYTPLRPENVHPPPIESLYGNNIFGYWRGALSGFCSLVHPRAPKLTVAVRIFLRPASSDFSRLQRSNAYSSLVHAAPAM